MFAGGGGRPELKGARERFPVFVAALFGLDLWLASANVAPTRRRSRLPAMQAWISLNAFAAAVEARGLLGRQIMPPLMGRRCFVMVESLRRALHMALWPRSLTGRCCISWRSGGHHALSGAFRSRVLPRRIARPAGRGNQSLFFLVPF